MKKSEYAFEIINYIFLAFVGFITVYPLIYTASISLSSMAEAAKNGLHLYPKEISFVSYQMVFSNSSLYTGYANTILRTVFGTAFSLIITAMTAYPLSKSYLPNLKLFSIIVLFTMIFEGGMIPNYLLIKKLKLIDNRLVYILPCAVSAYNIIIMKSFFKSLPESLSESAKIDGANDFRILWSIILPVSKPVLATVGLWTAVMHWNAWLDGMLYINDNSKQILQIFLQRIVKEGQSTLLERGITDPDVTSFTPETIKSATIIVTILPILIVYPFVQKYFVKGIMLGSVKG